MWVWLHSKINLLYKWHCLFGWFVPMVIFGCGKKVEEIYYAGWIIWCGSPKRFWDLPLWVIDRKREGQRLVCVFLLSVLVVQMLPSSSLPSRTTHHLFVAEWGKWFDLVWAMQTSNPDNPYNCPFRNTKTTTTVNHPVPPLHRDLWLTILQTEKNRVYFINYGRLKSTSSPPHQSLL